MDENLHEATELPEKSETTAVEANEPKTKSIHFKVSAYDPRGIEQWLSERAAEGIISAQEQLTLRRADEGRHFLHLARRKDRARPHAEGLYGFLRLPKTV